MRSPGSSRATSVLRQKRSCAYSAGTIIGSLRQAFTVTMVPVSAFSGCGPSGLKERESRQVPVHTSGIGSILTQARVIRIETSVGAVFAVAVVGLPGGVGGLEQDIGAARVVAHDEVDMARARFAQRDAKPPVAEGTVGVRDRLGAGNRWGE